MTETLQKLFTIITSEKREQFNIRLPHSIAAQIREAAKKAGLSQADYVVLLYLQHKDDTPKK